MSTHLPSTKPSTDQANVYYSDASLLAKLGTWLTDAKLSSIETRIEEYYTPWYVLDESSAPNAFTIDVYTRDKPESINTIILQSTGEFIETTEKPVAIFTTVKPKALADRGVKVDLNSTFHSSVDIKEGTLTDSSDEIGTIGGIDLISCVESWWDDNFIAKKVSNVNTYKNVVKEQLASLSSKNLDSMKKEYQTIDLEIDAYKLMLEQAEAGKEISFDSLKFNTYQGDLYPSLSDPNGAGSFSADNRLIQTANIVAQGVYDLSEAHRFVGGASAFTMKLGRGISQPDKHKLKISTLTPLTTETRSSILTACDTLWTKIVEKLTAADSDTVLSTYSISSIIDGKDGDAVRDDPNIDISSNNSTALYDLLHYDGLPVFSERGKLGEWFFDNFQKKYFGEDANFESLDSYIEEFKTTVNSHEKGATLWATGGAGLIVLQSIFKAIRDLCQSNCDVSTYAPEKNGGSFFDDIKKSPILGPRGCHPYPSKTSGLIPTDEEGKETVEVKDFSKTGFLVYPALLNILKMGNYSELVETLKLQMVNYKSNYDAVLRLWFAGAWGDYTLPACVARRNQWAAPTIGRGSATASRAAAAATDPADASKEGAIFWPYFKYDEITHANPDKRLYTGAPGGPDQVFNTERGAADSSRSFINWNKGTMPSAVFPWHQAEGPTTYEYDQPGASLMVFGSNPSNTGVHSRKYSVTFGLDSDTLDINRDVTQFFRAHGYNMPYYYASVVSIWKYILVESLKHCVSAVNSITGEAIELPSDFHTDEDILGPMLEIIGQIATNLYTETHVEVETRPMRHGGLVFSVDNTAEYVSHNIETLREDSNYQNTPGPFLSKIASAYANFIGMISKRKYVTRTLLNYSQSFRWNPYIPIEAIAADTNPNYAAGLGSTYLSTNFNSYYDPLEFSLVETLQGVPAQKDGLVSSSGTNIFSVDYARTLTTLRHFWKHQILFEKIAEGLENIKPYIVNLIPSDRVAILFEDGHFNGGIDIINPRKVINQISVQRLLFEADANGIANHWSTITDFFDVPGVGEKIKNDTIKYIFVLGISQDTFEDEDSTVKVAWEFLDTDGETTPGSSFFEIQYEQPTDLSTDIYEKESKQLLDYLHVARGINLIESIFSEKSKLVYGEDIVNNKAKIFPWKDTSFFEGEPLRLLDSIWTMSPWIFPRNYFYDVCLENRYQRVFAVYLTAGDLLKIPTSEDSPKYHELIGSIRWKITGS